MKPYTIDTNPEAHRRHVENVRAMTPAERVAAAFDVSAWAIDRALQIIRQQHPAVDESEARLILLERLYGTALVERVRQWRTDQPCHE